MACVIDGKQCTMCCRAIWLRKDVADGLERNTHPDAVFVRKNWVRISEDEAREINPYYFERYAKRMADLTAYNPDEAAFFKCTKVTEHGCGVYDSRPEVCRGYPYTSGRPWRRVAEHYVKMLPEYHPECTQWPVIPVKNIN